MKRSVSLLLAILTLILTITFSVFTVSAAETDYYIEELKMNITLPDDMIAVTRQSPETDKYYSIFGIDYELAKAEFEKENIYLRAMDEKSTRVLNVTMLSDEQSAKIGDYSNLTDDQLLDVQTLLLQQESYTSCTIERYDKNIFMNLQYTTDIKGNTVYVTQYNTVVAGNYINITLIPADGNALTSDDYQMLTQAISSVDFAGKNATGIMAILSNPIVMICVIVILIVGVMVLINVIIRKGKKRRKNAKKAEKKMKNQELLQELAQEYSLGAESTVSEYDEESEYVDDDYDKEESADDILEQLRREKALKEADRNRLYQQTAQKQEAVQMEQVKVYSDEEEDNPEEETQTYPVVNETKEVLRITPTDEEEHQPKHVGNKVYELYDDEDMYDENDDDYDDYDEDYEDEDYEDEDEQEVFGSEESFDQSDDYFDEGLAEDIYSRETIEDEDIYEESRRPSINKDAAKEKAKTAGAVVLNGLLIFLNGIKSFFVHLGYFFVNLSRMIKRAYKKHKYQQAQAQKRRQQEEARRRKQENLRRKQERQREIQENGLVQVRRRENPQSQNRRNRRP